MRRLVDIDLLGDGALQADMAMGSLWILIVGTLLGLCGMVLIPHEDISLMWFVLLLAVSAVALPVHEIVHAAAFKLVTGFSAHVTFGFTDWMLHTSAPGALLTRGRFYAVLLAPAILVTLALGCGFWAAGMPLLGWFLAVAHLSGCTGDLGYARIIASEPMAAWVEDTERGIALFYDE
jgi:hypothetical protein